MGKRENEGDVRGGGEGPDPRGSMSQAELIRSMMKQIGLAPVENQASEVLDGRAEVDEETSRGLVDRYQKQMGAVMDAHPDRIVDTKYPEGEIMGQRIEFNEQSDAELFAHPGMKGLVSVTLDRGSVPKSNSDEVIPTFELTMLTEEGAEFRFYISGGHQISVQTEMVGSTGRSVHRLLREETFKLNDVVLALSAVPDQAGSGGEKLDTSAELDAREAQTLAREYSQRIHGILDAHLEHGDIETTMQGPATAQSLTLYRSHNPEVFEHGGLSSLEQITLSRAFPTDVGPAGSRTQLGLATIATNGERTLYDILETREKPVVVESFEPGAIDEPTKTGLTPGRVFEVDEVLGIFGPYLKDGS